MDLMVVVGVLCLGAGLTCLALAVARIGDRTAQVTHAVMGVAMAGMASPWGDPVPAWAGGVAFAVLGAWFAAAALRGDRTPGARHLAVACGAMTLMYLMSGAAAGPHAGHAMAGMPGMAAMSGGAGLAAMPLALVLAGYFVWHAWICADRARTATGPAACAAPARSVDRTRAGTRLEPVAHGVMSGLMAAMFLGAV